MSGSPFERMAELHAREPEACPFGDYVAWHLRHAFLFSSPESFLMCIPVVKADLEAGRRPPAPLRGIPDCWYISGLAGDMKAAWAFEPFPLEWFAFDRAKHGTKRLSFHRRSRIQAKTNRHT